MMEVFYFSGTISNLVPMKYLAVPLCETSLEEFRTDLACYSSFALSFVVDFATRYLGPTLGFGGPARSWEAPIDRFLAAFDNTDRHGLGLSYLIFTYNSICIPCLGFICGFCDLGKAVPAAEGCIKRWKLHRRMLRRCHHCGRDIAAELCASRRRRKSFHPGAAADCAGAPGLTAHIAHHPLPVSVTGSHSRHWPRGRVSDIFCRKFRSGHDLIGCSMNSIYSRTSSVYDRDPCLACSCQLV